MLRPAVPADLPRLLAIRDASGADALSDPRLVVEADLVRLTASSAVTVWDENSRITGFAAIERGSVYLLVDSACRGKGVGRALLAAAILAVEEAGHSAVTLSLAAGGDAERHYRAAGWTRAALSPTGGIVLKKPL